MVVAAVQETRWFGNEVYRVGNSVVLAAGRPVPGVVIILAGPAVGVWKAGESDWKACSSRLVTATLVKGRRRCDCMLTCTYCVLLRSDLCCEQGREGEIL